MLALENVSHDREVTQLASSRIAVSRLWDVCQVPDYRKISSQTHAELVSTLYKFLMGPDERIPQDWFAQQVALADRTDGDIDTLATRIAHIRTWTFVSNRVDWLADPGHWQERTRAIEDSLSDALHERLTQRFVDRRTSALMKGLKEKDELYAEIADDGAVHVEKHYVGRLQGFRFFPDAQAEGIHGKAARHAATHVLTKELAMRVRRVVSAKNDAFKLARSGAVLWREAEIARLEAGEDPLKPTLVVLADEHLAAPDKARIQERLNTWIAELIGERLKPLVEVDAAQDIAGLARGIAFRLKENLGVLRRETVAEEIRSLDQPARAQLRKYGVRFGAFNIYFPTLLKPASSELAVVLWMLKRGDEHGLDIAAMPELPRAGLTSMALSAGGASLDAFYRVAGFHVCGPRAVRVDMLERLADLIRPLLTWRLDPASPGAPPKGATGDGGFRATSDMMSILGCSADELGHVLKALGFWAERRPVAPEVPLPAAPVPPESPAQPAIAADGAAEADLADAGPPETPVPSLETPAAQPEAPSDQPVETAAPEPAAAPPAETSEPKWEEIWRPRRKGRAFERPERDRRPAPPHRRDRAPRPHDAQARKGAEASGGTRMSHTPAHRDGKGPAQRRDHRRKAGKPREERARPHMQASPPASAAAFDPDSPFAALSSLKAALEKRSQE
jgi:ATP-dependent RNA helicase SUPV3L1/SUV3